MLPKAPQSAAPQRGEVGEPWPESPAVRTALQWLATLTTDDTECHFNAILAALSRPPVVRGMTDKENDLIEWMLKINEFNGAPIMWLSRLEHLANEVSAERALAVPPREGK